MSSKWKKNINYQPFLEVTYSVYRTAEMLPDKDIKLSMTVENGKYQQIWLIKWIQFLVS